MIKRFLRLNKRRLVIGVTCWMLFIAASLGLTAFQLRLGNLRELREVFARWKTPGHGRTVVVFAPHCDDETIATGGMLMQAAKKGADVWVVLMTNGDGFRAAAAYNKRSLVVPPLYFVEFGYRRQQETIAALEKLGVPRDRIITLGYPDRGLSPMFVTNWRAPYTSRYTRESRSPYVNSFTRSAEFTGSQCVADIKKTLRKIKPTDIYIPHPSDQHPDHWATSVFTSIAMHDLGWLKKKNVSYYIVHRGDWPVPQGLHTDEDLVPPAKLSDLDTRWREYPLTDDSIAAKKEAIKEFRSQKPGPQRFLRSFVRQNELFGTRNPYGKIPARDSITVDGKPDDWEGISPIISDATVDGLLTKSRPAADLAAVYAARDDDKLYFRIAVRGQVKRSVLYELRVHPLGGRGGTTTLAVRPGDRQWDDEWSIAYGKRNIEISCPADKWGERPLLVSVCTKYRWYDIDRSAYRIIAP